MATPPEVGELRPISSFTAVDFPAPLGAEEGDDLTATEGEREVVERDDAVGVALGDGGERGDCLGVGRGGCGGCLVEF